MHNINVSALLRDILSKFLTFSSIIIMFIASRTTKVLRSDIDIRHIPDKNKKDTTDSI